MRIAFYGAAHEVTGSCTVLYAAGKTIMVDCGLEQGPDIYKNAELPILPSEIDYLFLTHAHIDHSGKIPALVAGGFKGHIYCTAATEKLCNIMLLDSAYIQEFEARWRNRKAKRRFRDIVYVDAVNSNFAAVDIVEACEKVHDSCFTRTGCADNSYFLPCFNIKVEAFQHRLSFYI